MTKRSVLVLSVLVMLTAGLAADEKAAEGGHLPYVLLREGFEDGFASGKTILGKGGWTHAKSETSYLQAYAGASAHSGTWYAQFSDNYWSTHEVFHPIEATDDGITEATAWFRFSGYKGNADGKGLAGVAIAFHEAPDSSVDEDYITFNFGTNEQTGLAHVMFNNNGKRVIQHRKASGLTEDVRGKWWQVSLRVDRDVKAIVARHRPSTKEPWRVFHEATYEEMSWTPKYLRISGYNQAPDWHLCVDDIEVRASVGGKEQLSSLRPLGLSEGPPMPVPYREIPDPADDAERHVVVKAADRGPVWLYTGFLNNWRPEMDIEMISRLKPTHWRYGLWPFWTPSTITINPRPEWGDMRDSPEQLGEFMDAMMRLQADGMTWQMIVHHKGRYYGRWNITGDALKGYYDHIYTLVKYCRVMGAPFDYYEICNEPPEPHNTAENPGGYGPWRGTWQDFLGMWDTAHSAIRAAYPEAKIVGPSFGSCVAATIEPFLAHCKEKGQTLEVLSWHEITQGKVTFGPDYKGEAVVEPDKAHKNIMDVRRIVDEKYGDLGIEEYHIDEWGYTVQHTGPGTQIAYFHYFDLAGVDRAAKAHWTQGDLDGILVSAKTPRTSYWCWAEYAKQDGGLRLVTETDDRCVVALASRHDEAKEMRVLVARSKRHTGEEFAKKLPPVKTTIDVAGIPISGKAEVAILTLGPADGPLWEDDLSGLAARKTETIVDGSLSLTIDELAENQVVSIRIASPGTWATEARAAEALGRQKKVSQGTEAGKSLPYVIFHEGFEQGFKDRETILGKRGWVHAKNETSALKVFAGAKTAHSGERYAQFTENYWATNNCFHKISEQKGGVIEVTAWYRFPGYEGNKNGKGIGAALIGLCETPDRKGNENFVTFKFGTHEQNGYSVVIFANGKARRINWTDASDLREDVRGKWHQVSLVLDMEARRVTARHRASAKGPWKVFHSQTFKKMDWVPKYVLISGYNLAPDWRFCVDDVEVRSSEISGKEVGQ